MSQQPRFTAGADGTVRVNQTVRELRPEELEVQRKGFLDVKERYRRDATTNLFTEGEIAGVGPFFMAATGDTNAVLIHTLPQNPIPEHKFPAGQHLMAEFYLNADGSFQGVNSNLTSNHSAAIGFFRQRFGSIAGAAIAGAQNPKEQAGARQLENFLTQKPEIRLKRGL